MYEAPPGLTSATDIPKDNDYFDDQPPKKEKKPSEMSVCMPAHACV
jgi:hypothetical protein